MNKVYLVVEDYSYECDFGANIEVFDTKEKALKYLGERKGQLLVDNDFDTIENDEEYLSMYDSGYYRTSHNDIYIKEKEVK